MNAKNEENEREREKKKNSNLSHRLNHAKKIQEKLRQCKCIQIDIACALEVESLGWGIQKFARHSKPNGNNNSKKNPATK